MNHQRVSRIGAFDEERSCLRIACLAALHARGVNATRVDRRGDHVVARVDSKHGFMSAGERVVEFRGLKPMGFGEAGNGQRKHQKQCHIYPLVWASISELIGVPYALL